MLLWNGPAYRDNHFLWHWKHRRRTSALERLKAQSFAFMNTFDNSFTYTKDYISSGFILSSTGLQACSSDPSAHPSDPCGSLCCRATAMCVWCICLQKCVLMRSCSGRSSLCTLSPTPLCGSAKQSLSHQAEPLRILQNQLTQQHQSAGVSNSYKDQSRG